MEHGTTPPAPLPALLQALGSGGAAAPAPPAAIPLSRLPIILLLHCSTAVHTLPPSPTPSSGPLLREVGSLVTPQRLAAGFIPLHPPQLKPFCLRWLLQALPCTPRGGSGAGGVAVVLRWERRLLGEKGGGNTPCCVGLLMGSSNNRNNKYIPLI